MFHSLPKQRKYIAFYFLKLFPPLVNIIFPCVLLCFLINLFPFLCIFFSYSDSGIYNNYTALKCAIDKGLNHCSSLLHAIYFLILVWIYLINATFNCLGCNLRLQTLGYVDCCYQLINGHPVMMKWHFLMFSGGFFSLFFPFLLFRPSTKRGADLGEAVPGGEAQRSGGAAGDVRARAGAAAAAALSREAAPAQQRQALLHCSGCTAESQSLDRGEVRILELKQSSKNYKG